MDIESSAIDFLEGKPVQKGNRGQHVSGGFDETLPPGKASAMSLSTDAGLKDQ